MAITVERVGRRSYLIGNTYPRKDAIRAAGGKWDGDRRAWWIGSDDKAREIADKCGGGAAQSSGEGSCSASSERPAPGTGATVAGRAKYKGRTYYMAGRVERGRTHWDDSIDAVTTRDGAKYLLYFRDGSKSFWAARSEVQVDKRYSRPTTIARLQQYAQQARSAGVGQLEDGYYVRDGEVLASGCGECSRLGTMCRSCQHDYD